MLRVPADKPILLLDDDDVDRMILTRVLRRSHLRNEAVEFASGEVLWTHLEEVVAGRSAWPALILLDINMPGLTGFDLLTRIRSTPSFAELPVVAMVTSSDAERDRRQARELGADGYIAKQSGIDHYVSAIEELFSNG